MTTKDSRKASNILFSMDLPESPSAILKNKDKNQYAVRPDEMEAPSG
jgi:hypothetical protein